MDSYSSRFIARLIRVAEAFDLLRRFVSVLISSAPFNPLARIIRTECNTVITRFYEISPLGGGSFLNNGEVTSLIYRAGDKPSAIPGARKTASLLAGQPFASALPLVLLPFTTHTRMARAANRLISRDLIWHSIKIFAHGR